MYSDKPFLARLFLRLIRYSAGSGLTFALDIALLAIFITTLPFIHPTVLMACSFFVAISCNYLVARQFVYPDSAQTTGRGYGNFIGIGIVSIGVIVVVTLTLTEQFDTPLLITRIGVGILVGVGNFLANTFLNFRVV